MQSFLYSPRCYYIINVQDKAWMADKMMDLYEQMNQKSTVDPSVVVNLQGLDKDIKEHQRVVQEMDLESETFLDEAKITVGALYYAQCIKNVMMCCRNTCRFQRCVHCLKYLLNGLRMMYETRRIDITFLHYCIINTNRSSSA